MVSALVVAGLAAAVAFAASTDFSEPSSSPVLVAPGPTWPAIADVDGDGDRDVAVASEGADAVTILINNGSGNLHERATNSPVSTGADPVAMVATDLDGDGDPDLATADQIGHDVTVLINNGSGSFRERSTSPEAGGSRPFALAAADIDGDTDQDLLVADTFDGIHVLRNNGAANFSELGSSPELAGRFPSGLALADLDGDADLDLAVTNGGDDTVSILRNNGRGNFAEEATSPEATDHEPFGVVAADLDSDGDPDLAITNQGRHDVTILRNNGRANFSQPAFSPEVVDLTPLGIVARDFDGDTDTDLAVADRGSDAVSILDNTGSGDFVEAPTSPESTGDQPVLLDAGDLDGDADDDLVVSDNAASEVTVLENR